MEIRHAGVKDEKEVIQLMLSDDVIREVDILAIRPGPTGQANKPDIGRLCSVMTPERHSTTSKGHRGVYGAVTGTHHLFFAECSDYVV
jgi:hypothetical protein